MKLKQFLIDRLAAFLLGSDAWGNIQGVVNVVESPDLSGAEKRAKALQMLEKLGLSLAGYLLNLGLELAVAKLRTIAA